MHFIALFLVNWATMAALIVKNNLRFEENVKLHDIHTQKNICVTIYYIEWYVGFWRMFSYFEN